MAQFDLTKFLAEGKLYEAMFDVEATTKIAQHIADAFTAEDSNDLDLKYVVSPDVEAGHFNLDVEAGENTPGEDWKDENGFDISNYLGKYAGGTFMVKDGVVVNSAMRSAPVARVSPEGEVEMISAEESRAAIGMEENKDQVNEGTWAIGKPEDIQKVLDMLQQISDFAYDVIGDDRFMDKIDGAIARAEEFLETSKSRLEEENQPSNTNKMKKSELKEMIKAAMMAETSVAEAENVDVTDDENVDVKDEENVDVDVEKDVAVDDESTEADIDVKASVAGETEDVEAVQGLLTKALEMSQALGDEKLEDQIGNTITYFTRAHVSKVNELALDVTDTADETEMEAGLGLEEAKENLNESVTFPMWNKIK